MKTLHSIAISITTVLLLTACSTSQWQINNSNEAHIKKLNKKKKRFVKREQKVDLKKFCFKDASSIHYRAKERCK